MSFCSCSLIVDSSSHRLNQPAALASMIGFYSGHRSAEVLLLALASRRLNHKVCQDLQVITLQA